MQLNDPRTHGLISIKSVYAELIYEGIKTVELRRRPIRLPTESVLWIYETLPAGRVRGHVTVQVCHAGSRSAIWREFGIQSGVSRATFFDYFCDADTAYALQLHSPTLLDRPIDLRDLRKSLKGFQPPQHFMRLPAGNTLREMLDGKKIKPDILAA